MRVRVAGFDLGAIDCSTRLPFRFGMTTLTAAPLLLARLQVELDGGDVTEGFASDLLVPKWFEKDPAKGARDDIRDLLLSAHEACAAAVDCGEAASAFDLWHALASRRVETLPIDAPNRLVQGFGVALVERAVIDAAARGAGVSFAELIRGGRAGFQPGRVHPDLGELPAGAVLAASPLETVHVRHTVGLADSLRRRELDATDRIDDGFPESLEEDVERYGLTYFKVKIAGDLDADLARLRLIDEVLEMRSPDYRFTLDGNEQLSSIEMLRSLLDGLAASPAGAAMRRRLLYVEQPLARANSFEVERLTGIDDLGVDVIIDESDASIDAFSRAFACGYRGVSVKNCKGVFRALANRALAERLGGFQSAEDLTNLPVVALQQDLATVAALGLTHVERNGHHYFRGLDHLPGPDRHAALEHHPDLYASAQDGGVSLRIDAGCLRIASLQCPGYGVGCPVVFDDWPSVEALMVGGS